MLVQQVFFENEVDSILQFLSTHPFLLILEFGLLLHLGISLLLVRIG